MRFQNLLHFGLPTLCTGFALLIGVNFLFLFQTQTEMHRSSDRELAVMSDAQRISTTDTETLIARFAALQIQSDAVAARRTYGDLLERLNSWPNLTYREVVGQSDYIDEKINNIRKSSQRVLPYLDNLSDHTATSNALIILQGINISLQQINQMVLQEAVRQSEAARVAFQFHQLLQGGLVLAFVLSGMGWIGLLSARMSAFRQLAATSREHADDLAKKLSHDTATGLINHNVFLERVREVGSSLSEDQTLSVLSIDLETRLPAHTKFSQATEEAVIAATADLLRHAADRLDAPTCLARSAGKGFLLMCVSEPEIGLPAAEIASRIHDIFLRPVQTPLGSFQISPAIGYASSSSLERDPADVVRNASLAVANAVDHGRRRVTVFEPTMQAELERRMIVENALSAAIDENECLPHFQPQFNLTTGRIFGVEALARWYHSELGWISPSEFIPIAENNGDIVSLGWKILETSCSEVQLLPSDLSLSVNLSVAQILSDDVVAMMDECLARTGLPARRLKLEVTEATLMNDLKLIQATLTELRALGVRISLDDFGIGYSALSYLTDFHWDEIKIDGSFAGKAVKDHKQRDVLKLVLGIAETMGSSVLIEGIETVEQRDVLVDLGCRNGQGYLFGGPMAIDDITTLFFNAQGQRSFAGI